MFDLRRTLDLMEQGAFDDAIAALQQAIAQMPAYVPAYVLLAQAYEAQERWPEALAAWQRARFFAPNSPTVEAGLLRMLDEHDVISEESADALAPDLDAADMIDRMADELFGTIHEEEPPAAPDTPPSEAPETPHAEESSEEPDADDDAASDDEPPPPSPPDTSPDNEAKTHRSDPTPPEPAPPPAEEASEEDAPPAPDSERDDTSSTNATHNLPSATAATAPLEELTARFPNLDQPLPKDIEDLDRLIEELEDARIDPQPDLDDVPPPDLDNDIEDMVSETLARIYISQKQYAEAARVYLRLATQEPERAQEYKKKADDLRARARGQDTE